MGFLTPAFLAGLFALAVPILVHLTHRPRSDTIAFPSLMFLQRIPYRSVRRQSLRHWLLFALRCAAFALLALAFARPFFGTSSRAATRYAPALRLAEETLEGSPLARREIVLITDFQKVGWEGGDDVRLPPSTTLTWVDLSEKGASNVAITGVDLERDYVGGRERV